MKHRSSCECSACIKQRASRIASRIHNLGPLPKVEDIVRSDPKLMLQALRDEGWMVAVHNDYVLDTTPHTFWLLTRPSTDHFVKGEGLTDEEALRECLDATKRLDESDKWDGKCPNCEYVIDTAAAKRAATACVGGPKEEAFAEVIYSQAKAFAEGRQAGLEDAVYWLREREREDNYSLSDFVEAIKAGRVPTRKK